MYVAAPWQARSIILSVDVIAAGNAATAAGSGTGRGGDTDAATAFVRGSDGLRPTWRSAACPVVAKASSSIERSVILSSDDWACKWRLAAAAASTAAYLAASAVARSAVA